MNIIKIQRRMLKVDGIINTYYNNKENENGPLNQKDNDAGKLETRKSNKYRQGSQTNIDTDRSIMMSER